MIKRYLQDLLAIQCIVEILLLFQYSHHKNCTDKKHAEI